MLYDPRHENTTASILIRARALIADENNWCQNSFGWQNRYCAAAAISVAANEEDRSTYTEARCFLNKLIDCSLTYFNDTHTHAEVIALLDRGIVEAGKLGS